METYQAVQRNFNILKTISLKQQEEFHSAMRHTNEVEKKSEILQKDNTRMKGRYDQMSTELDRLKKKEMEFNEVLSKRLEQQNEVDVLKT